MTTQSYSSANTSVNSSKLPAIYGKMIADQFRDAVVYDYGCGKYTDHIRKHIESHGGIYLPYDKYNMDDHCKKMSEISLKLARNDGRHIIGICSNVLNVIKEDEIVREIIDHLMSVCDIAHFTVYEGNGTGVGRQSKTDCWQRNEKSSHYAEMIEELGYSYGVKNKILTAWS